MIKCLLPSGTSSHLSQIIIPVDDSLCVLQQPECLSMKWTRDPHINTHHISSPSSCLQQDACQWARAEQNTISYINPPSKFHPRIYHLLLPQAHHLSLHLHINITSNSKQLKFPPRSFQVLQIQKQPSLSLSIHPHAWFQKPVSLHV